MCIEKVYRKRKESNSGSTMERQTLRVCKFYYIRTIVARSINTSVVIKLPFRVAKCGCQNKRQLFAYEYDLVRSMSCAIDVTMLIQRYVGAVSRSLALEIFRKTILEKTPVRSNVADRIFTARRRRVHRAAAPSVCYRRSLHPGHRSIIDGTKS